MSIEQATVSLFYLTGTTSNSNLFTGVNNITEIYFFFTHVFVFIHTHILFGIVLEGLQPNLIVLNS